MKNKKLWFFCMIFCIASVGVLFFLRSADFSESTKNSVVPSGVTIDGTFVFLDESRIIRDDFLIHRVIGQTDGVYLAAVVDAGEHSLNIGVQSIVLASECLTVFSDFFAEPPEWEAFIIAATDERGWLYVLGTSTEEYLFMRNRSRRPENINLFIYNSAGQLEEKINWSVLPAGFPVTYPRPAHVSAYVSDGVLVYIVGSFNIGEPRIVVLSKTGEVLYLYEQREFTGEPLISGTVGGGYVYGLFASTAGYIVRKFEIPTGNLVWENSWFHETGNIENIFFCNRRQRLYLFHPSHIFVYDGTQVHMLRDLTSTRFRVNQSVLMAHAVSMAALGDGRLHMTFYYTNSTDGVRGSFAGYSEWLLTPYFDDDATNRIQKRVAEWADIPVIRHFDFAENPGMSGIQFDLMRFAESRGVFAEFTFLRGSRSTDFRSNLNEYTEVLNTALFSGTAQWDIINIPGAMAPNSEFDINAFVERNMLHELLPYFENVLVDNEKYYTHLFEALKTNGLYHIPTSIYVPFLFVPNDDHRLEYLRSRSQNWTWAEFFDIVAAVKEETGVPPISYDDIFWWLRPIFVNPISNVPPFFLFDEELLLAMGAGERKEEFAEAVGLFANLVSPRYSRSDALSIFTFACMRSFNFIETHEILPMPSMRGEYIFFTPFYSYGVLTAGANPQLAAEFLAEHFHNRSSGLWANNQSNIFSLKRPGESLVQRWMPLDVFAAYENVVYKANTFLHLPGNIRLAVYDAVLQYVHGAISRSAAVERAADIMWIFVNE
ncbi:MAG: extracellular solute-binding protein [Defluviitaleaceae bacterium]|nr:extracellular solute-binding protein [Defluviitaleaceae bacterium]